eukprot:3670316-Karenia_brevis.AAC.1
MPPHISDLGPDVWSPEGIRVLGTPVGTQSFTNRLLEERQAQEQELWNAMPCVSDLQCAWQLLVQCASPRANHVLRTVPPNMCQTYAKAHDDGLWQAAQSLLGDLPGDDGAR